MLRGLYTATAGMLTQMQKQQTLSNNLANVTTPGFKEDLTAIRSFPDMLLEKQMGASSTPIGNLSTGVYAQENLPDFSIGSPEQTNQPTDVALVNQSLPVDPTTNKQGALFFTLQQPDGTIRYTRNGNFSLDGLNRLTTSDGNLVLDTNGQPITITDNQFKVEANGAIIQNGSQTGQLGMAYAADPYQLEKDGDGLFKVSGTGANLPMANSVAGISFGLQQGSLEQSNVQLDKTMTDLMTAYRSFEANQKVLKTYDSTLDLAVNKVGVVE